MGGVGKWSGILQPTSKRTTRSAEMESSLGNALP